MHLGNGIIALEFDDRTASLVQIEDLRTGAGHLGCPADGRLFRIVAPDEDRWLDQYWDSHECPPPETARRGGSVTFHWPVLASGGASAEIDVTVTVKLPEGRDEALFTIRIHNCSGFLIHEVWFPRVGGWRGGGGAAAAAMTIGCGSRIDPFAIRGGWAAGGYTLVDHHRRRFHGVVPSVELPMVDVSGDAGGLSYVCYATRVGDGGVVVEDLNERVGATRPAWSWVHRPFAARGETWASDPVGIAPHAGDWHATADRLRAWLETWWSPPPTPRRLRSAIGYFNVQSREFAGRTINPLESMPAEARFALDHGIRDFCLWDTIMATYLKPGDGEILAEQPERLDTLRRVLREIRAMGIQISTLVNLRLLSRKYAPWRDHGEAWVMRTLYGQPQNEMWSSVRGKHAAFLNSWLDECCGVMCQHHPDFQEWALKKIDELLDLGFSSIFIDQPFEMNPCFAADHGHRPGAHGHEGACRWIQEAVGRIRRRDPEAYAIGENGDIWNTQHLQLWWTWAWRGMLPEVFRYVLPQSPQSWIIDALEHEQEVGRPFALGFLLALNVRGLELPLSAVPEFAERIGRLAELRRRTADCTVGGRFLDRTGLTLDTDADVAAAVYDAGGAVGVVLGDTSEGPRGGGAIKLCLDLPALGKAGAKEVRLHREDGATDVLPAAAKSDRIVLETRLGRRQSAVVEVRCG